MPSIDIELDYFELSEAVERAIGASQIEQLVSDAVSESEISDIWAAVQRIEDALEEKPTEKQLVGRPNEHGIFSGFRTGEHVILINKLHPRGIRGVVDPNAFSSINWENTVPVKRDDTGVFDIFPAQHVVLASSLVEYLEQLKLDSPEPEVEPEPQQPKPTGDPISYNLTAFESAISQQLGTEFTYVTPSPSYSSAGPTTKRRRFRPEKLDYMGPDDRSSLILGYDLDAKDLRSFRIDRIEGYVSITPSL